ncbi:hypothetical protein CPB84DRAFT_1793424 [Gymnopilus junonius]|uniref:Uncharacterized protein n=1 Tax=Gymnopilus junonius TaxID=109634 RepID=A0A9P5NDP1_GYMJU|nr:hypothetical protein CPB84DRAFT_1793424 [Gymnopilus junonius]
MESKVSVRRSGEPMGEDEVATRGALDGRGLGENKPHCDSVTHTPDSAVNLDLSFPTCYCQQSKILPRHKHPSS